MVSVSYPWNVRQAVSNAQEAHTWFDQAFDETVVLFNQIVEIVALSELTQSGKIPGGSHFLEGFWGGCIFIDSDDARSHRVGRMKRFCEKALRGLGIAGGAQPKFQRVPDGESPAR